MAIFGSSEIRDAVKRLSNKEFASNEERDELLAKLSAAEGLRARDVTWLLFRPDRAMRDTGSQLLKKIRDPETLDCFLGETKGKPEAAMRAAANILLTLNVGIESRMPQLLATPAKESKETRELQE